MDAISFQPQRASSPVQQLPKDVDSNHLGQVSPKASSTKPLAKRSKKDIPKPWKQKRSHCHQRSPAEAIVDVCCEKHSPPAPEITPCYYRVNWPNALLQKWAKEKESRARSFSPVIRQDEAGTRNNAPGPIPEGHNCGCGESEDNKGFHQN